MKCPTCDHRNREKAKFCDECGARLKRVCPACDASNRAAARFCGECGCDLRERPRAPAIDYSEPQSYTPKFLADKILTTRASMEGERKIVTVLFADVAGFTAMSETLDPEDVHQIMDDCFKLLMDEIHGREGTINQFTGDGVMALFGAPVAHEDHAQRACHAALAIQKAVNIFGESVRKEYDAPFRMRMGLNSGPVIVGAIGDNLRMDYTAIGDTVNLAARMEGLARPGAVLASGSTHGLARDFFEFRSLGKVEVKGKKEPQETFELIKPGEVETRIGASAVRGLTRFVGRKKAMADLMEAYETAKSGAGRVVGLVGEPGVGKSRMLIELRRRTPRDECIHLEGRCLHFGGSMTYLPIHDILRSWFDIKEGEPETSIKRRMEKRILELDEALTGALPPLWELLSLPVDDEAFAGLDPGVKRERTFEAVRDLLVRISREKPLVVAVEDLHWIDKTSEQFLDYLIDRLPNTRILLILLYRPEYVHSWGSKSWYAGIGLRQLTPSESVELVRAVLDDGEADPDLRRLILDRSSGNPLFMEEFTQNLLQNGAMEKRDKTYALSADVEEIQIPDTIQGIISARLDRLEENMKHTMQVASVIGRDFAYRILQSITGMSKELKSCLFDLQGLEFIYEKNLFPELEYIFKHALIQEVTYNSLLLRRRSEIHKKIGEAIEILYADRLEEFYAMLAYHFSKSDSRDKAHRYSRLAGEKAEAAFSHWEAFAFYKGAVKMQEDAPESPGNKRNILEVLSLMRVPMLHLGYPEGSLEFLEAGKKLARELNDSGRLVEFYTTLGYYHTFGGDPAEGMKYTANAFEEAKKGGDIQVMAPLASSLCFSYDSRGEYARIIDVAAHVLHRIEEAKGRSDFHTMITSPYCVLSGFCGCAMGWLGDFEKGEATLENGLRLASEIDDLFSLGFVELLYGRFLSARANWKAAATHFENCIRYCDENKMLLISSLGRSLLGDALALLGDPETGRRYTEKGLSMFLESGIEAYLSMHHLILGRIHRILGDFASAGKSVREALELSGRNHEKDIEARAWMELGRLAAGADPPDAPKAREHLLKGLEIFDLLEIKAQYARGCLLLGELYLKTDQREKALEHLQKAEEMFEEMGIEPYLARAREAAETV